MCHDVCYRLIFRSISCALSRTEFIRHSYLINNLHWGLLEEYMNATSVDHSYTCVTFASNKLSPRKRTATCFPDVFTTCNRSFYKDNCLREIPWPGFPTKSTEYFAKAWGISSPLYFQRKRTLNRIHLNTRHLFEFGNVLGMRTSCHSAVRILEKQSDRITSKNTIRRMKLV